MFTRSILHFLWLFTAFILFCGTASNEDARVIKLESAYHIIPKNPDSPSTLGDAGGLRQCGGPGKAIAMRYFYCKGEHPCKIPGGTEKKPAELEFIPSQDVDVLGIRAFVIWEGGMQTLINRPLSNSTVQSGQSYISTAVGAPGKELIGKKYMIRWSLYRVEDDQVEVCGEADFEVVEP